MNVDAFISYAGSDRRVAGELAASLQRADVDVWWDALLPPGESFDATIQAVLAQAKVIVGLLSPRTLASDWVRWELSQAIANGLEVFLVLVHGVGRETLPPPLGLVQAIELPVLDPAGLGRSAARVSTLVHALDRRSVAASRRGVDARRRLAQAATETAMQARQIKARNRRSAENPAGVDQQRNCSFSPGLARMLRARDISLALTSPDAGKLFLVSCDPAGELSITAADFEGPTGICLAGDSLVLADPYAIHTLENVLNPGQLYNGRFSHCFVARRSHFIGALAPHDLAVTPEGPSFVSSRYSCIATVSPVHSFSLQWKPPFITEIVPEDRCHLNGLALRQGQLAYVTAFDSSNSIDGWRARPGGGVVLDIRSDEIVCDGLAMPHSPRFHGGDLWLLNSGNGELGKVALPSRGRGAFESVSRIPGFARGLAFHDDLAFAGVSRPRHQDLEGLEIGAHPAGDNATARAGFAVIDTGSGECIQWLWLAGDAHEVYDLAVLPGVGCATACSADTTEAWGLVTME